MRFLTSTNQVYNSQCSHFVSFAVSVKSDPFGGDPFKGSDPFAADSFFQAPSAPFASDDPFTASAADLFGTTAGLPEPDLFATKPSDVAAGPAAGPDPFSSKPTNPAVVAKDPFSTTVNNLAVSDAFGGTTPATGEADPFGTQDEGADPFNFSLPTSDLAVVSGPAVQMGLDVLALRFIEHS